MKAKLRGKGDYSWAAAVGPKPAPTETRVEREKRIEKALADAHYDKPLGHRNGYPRVGCLECAVGVRWFTYALSAPYHAPRKIRWGSR